MLVVVYGAGILTGGDSDLSERVDEMQTLCENEFGDEATFIGMPIGDTQSYHALCRLPNATVKAVKA